MKLDECNVGDYVRIYTGWNSKEDRVCKIINKNYSLVTVEYKTGETKDFSYATSCEKINF